MNNSFYAFGGETESGIVTNQLYAFEFPTKQWVRIFYPPDPNGNPSITGRTRAVSIVHNDLLWVIGGTRNPEYTTSSSSFENAKFDSVYQFDYQQMFFQFIPTRGAIPKGWGFASAVLNNRFYLFGGAQWGEHCIQGTADLYEFDPATFFWRKVNSAITPPARYGAAMVGFTNVGSWPYSLILFGGADGGSETKCNSPYLNDMWRLGFNDVTQLDGIVDWEPLNYTSWRRPEPFGQAFMNVGQEKDAMYVYGGVYGNLQRKVLKNLWEFNATEKYWRPMLTVRDSLPYSCSASANTQPGTPQRLTYGNLRNNTAGLFMISFGGYSFTDRKPWKIENSNMNVLYNLAPPAAGVLTELQILYFAVLGPICAVFLLLLFIFMYRRNQDLAAANRIKMSYKQVGDGNQNESLLAGLKDGEVPEDPALYFQMMQNQEKKNSSTIPSTSGAPSSGASVYSPMPGMPGYTGTNMGYSVPSSAGASIGIIPGGTAYGQMGGTAYGAVGGTAYGAVGGTAYGAVGGNAYGQMGGTAYGTAYGYGGYNYGNPAASTQGSTLIGEVSSVNNPSTGATETVNSTIIEEIGSVNRGDYAGSTGLTVVEDFSGGIANAAPRNFGNNATIIDDAQIVNPSGSSQRYTSNEAAQNATIIDDAVMVNPNNRPVEQFTSTAPTAVATIIDTAVESFPQTVVETATENVPATLIETAEVHVPATVIETAEQHVPETIVETAVENVPEPAVDNSVEDVIPSTLQILEQEVANARNRAISSYPLPDDAEEHISSMADSELTATINPEYTRNLTVVESAAVGFPEQLNLSSDLAVDDSHINPIELITDLWSGPVRVATFALDAVNSTVRENAKGLEVAAVKFWTPARSVPDEVIDVLARREILVLNFLKNTPNVIQFVGYASSPLRVLTRIFNSTLHQELHDSSNFKWSEPDVKRSVINDLITGFLYIHGKGIIHNRLNPKTVLVQYTQERSGPTAVLGDFSNAMMVGTDADSPLNNGAFVSMQ